MMEVPISEIRQQLTSPVKLPLSTASNIEPNTHKHEDKAKWPTMFRPVRMSEFSSRHYNLLGVRTAQASDSAQKSHKRGHSESQCTEPLNFVPLLKKTEAHPNRNSGISTFKKTVQENAVSYKPDEVKTQIDKQNLPTGSRATLKLKIRKVEQQPQQQTSQKTSTPPTEGIRQPPVSNLEYLEVARRRNSMYLLKMFADQREDFHKLLDSLNGGEQAMEWKLGQSAVEHPHDDFISLRFFNDYVDVIDQKQQTIGQLLKRRKRKHGSTLVGCILDNEECKLVTEWYLGTDRTLFSAQQIDSVLKKLNHFRILLPKIRLQTYVISDVVECKEGDTIIAKDSFASYLYVILRGAVAKLTQEHFGGITKLLSNSLHDGQLFGYLDSFSGEGIYNYSVVAEECCLLMRLPYQQYVSIQSSFLSNELSTKVTFLGKLECFSHIATKDLIPLATLLKERKVPNGEYIVREGQIVGEFLILTKGSATVTKCNIITRSKPKRKNYFAKSPFQPATTRNSFHRPKEYRKARPLRQVMNDGKVRCNYQLLTSSELQDKYMYLYDLRQLVAGDCIGYRAVKKNNGKYNGSERYRLSVLSTSNDCSLLVLSSEEVCKIPDYLLHPLLRYCEEQRDVDEVCIEALSCQIGKQERFKVQLLQQIREDHENARRSSFKSI